MVGQFWPNVTGRRYFADIIGLFSTTVMLSACKAIKFGEMT